jgi:hypothetical protein
MRPTLLLWCIVIPSLSFGQAKRAQNLLAKEKYELAYEVLLKATAKDSLAAAEKFVLSTLFMLDSFPGNNIDSAYTYILNGLDDLSRTDGKTLARLARDNFDEKVLSKHKQHIEAVAFEPVKAKDTEEAYITYLRKYPTAIQKDSAIIFRNAVAFLNAAQRHTYQSYQRFFEKYPDANEVPEARERYELLLFEHFTEDGKLVSFVNFLTDYPNTLYRSNCERQIFIITTGSNQSSDYLQFIKNFPDSFYSKKAIDMLYHLAEPGTFTGLYPDLVISDSLKRVISEEREMMILVPNEDKYQYINLDNEVIIDNLTWVSNSFKCEPVNDYILAAKDDIRGLYDRGGRLILESDMTSAVDAGAGFIIATGAGKDLLVHKSGTLFGQREHNEVHMAFPYVAYRDNEFWGLVSVTGLPLLAEDYDTIFSLGDNLVLRKENKTGIFPNQLFIPALDGGRVKVELTLDLVEPLSEKYILIVKEEQEGLLNYDLEMLVPLAEQTIELIDDGYFIDRSDSIYHSTYSNRWFTEIVANADWSVGKTTEKFHVKYLSEPVFEASDVELIGSHGLLRTRNDTLFLMLSDTTSLVIENDQQVSALPMLSTSAESSHYKIVSNDKKTPDIIDRFGNRIRLPRYINVHDLGEEFLLVQTKKNYSVFNNKGQPVLKNLDGASALGNGLLSIFADRKFGLYSIKDSVNIPLIYSQHLKKVSDSLFVAKKGDQLGVINKQNKEILPFIYAAINEINDSLVFVTTGYRMAIVNLLTRRTLVDQLSGLEPMFENDEESIFKLLRNAEYGIFGTRNGLILDATFSEVNNIGTELVPVYLAEIYVDEAELYILLYYNRHAGLFKKLVLSVDQYDALQCDRQEF